MRKRRPGGAVTWDGGLAKLSVLWAPKLALGSAFLSGCRVGFPDSGPDPVTWVPVSVLYPIALDLPAPPYAF